MFSEGHDVISVCANWMALGGNAARCGTYCTYLDTVKYNDNPLARARHQLDLIVQGRKRAKSRFTEQCCA